MISNKYRCYKCNSYETTRFNDMKKHICRKNACYCNFNNVLISEDQMLLMSLYPYYGDKHTIKLDELKHLDGSDIIYKNKHELFDEILCIEKNNIHTCKYCNKKYKLYSELKRHILINCFHSNLVQRNITNINIVDNSNNTITSNNNNQINNIYNNCDINNNVNNINFFVDLKTQNKLPMPFEDNWDLSEITQQQRSCILISDYIYTGLLKAILDNDVNNNVIIDSDKRSGMVYLNHDDKYISMKPKQIAEKTMEKLHKNLIDINNDIKNNINNIVYRVIRHSINDKNNEYNSEKEIKKDVDNLICGIYNNKKAVAQQLAENQKKSDLNNRNKKKDEKIMNNNEENNNNDTNEDYNTKIEYKKQISNGKY